MRLCGISSRFQLLSPCVGQVSHALLTRPPLSHKHLHPEGICRKCFVRLACVKHAASVHPEPGSNSHVECLILSEQSLALFLESVITWFEFSSSNLIDRNFSLLESSVLSNLSRLFHYSVIKVLCCFSFERQL